jgi:hypothetical protein
VQLERLGKLKKFNDLIGTQTIITTKQLQLFNMIKLTPPIKGAAVLLTDCGGL